MSFLLPNFPLSVLVEVSFKVQATRGLFGSTSHQVYPYKGLLMVYKLGYKLGYKYLVSHK